MIFKLKENVTFKDLKKFGYSKGIRRPQYYVKYFTKSDRIVIIDSEDKEITDLKLDRTTKTGFAFETEYRHMTRHYIKDLIEANMIDIEKEIV